MNIDDLNKEIKEQYTHMKHISGKGMCGIQRLLFTTGLVVGIDNIGYEGRYCYNTHNEAVKALDSFTEDDIYPEGDWIKYKGRTGEFNNPNKEE